MVARFIAAAAVAAMVLVGIGCEQSGAAKGGTSSTDQHVSAEGRAPKADGQDQTADSRQPTAVPWPIYRGDAALTGVAAGTLPDNPELLWSYQTEGAIVSSPVVADGRVYVGSDDGNLYCLDFETGEKMWSYATEFLIEAAPLVHDGIVYVGSHDFYLHAVDAVTGEGKWKFETYEKIVGSANVIPASMRRGGEEDSPTPATGGDPPAEPGANGVDENDWIVVGSHDAFVYALDAKTGEKQWETETNDRVNGTVAITDGRIIFGGCDTILYAADAATGALTPLIELGGECNIAASVAVRDGRVYFGHNANEIVCFDPATGELAWRYGNSRFGFFAAPAVTDTLVIVGGRDSRLHAIDRATGDPVWAFATRRKIDSSPVVCGDRVVTGSGDGRIYIVDVKDGTEIWSYDAGKSIFSSPAVVDGRILIGCNDGRLLAFGAAKSD